MSDQILPQRWVEAPAPMVREEQGFAPEPGEESALTAILNLVGLLRRNWRTVLGATLLTLAGAAFLIRRSQPMYRATATVKFDDKGRALAAGLGGTAAQQVTGHATDPLLTQIQVLQSRGVAREVVRREGLRVTSQPQFLPDAWITGLVLPDNVSPPPISLIFGIRYFTASDGGRTVRGTYGDPLQLDSVTFTVARKPGVPQVTLNIASLDEAADNVLEGLHGKPRDRTDILDVSYESPNPRLAQRVANAASTVFQELNASNAKQESVRRRQFIETQLLKTETLLTEAAASHNSFRSREKVFSSQEKFKSEQAGFAGIELRRQELSADRGMFIALLQSLQDSRKTTSTSERLNALVSSPGIAANVVVAGLYSQLTRLQATRDSLISGPFGASASNPDVARIDALLAGTEGKIAGAVRGQIAAVDARLAALDELKRRSAGEMSVLPTTEAEETTLLAGVETYRKEAERLREQLQKAQIEEAAQVGQIEILDLATYPSGPIGTGNAPRILFALILGLAAGAVGAYVIENYSAVVRRREDVERVTSFPVLSVVPPFTLSVSNERKFLPWRKEAASRSTPAMQDHAEELVIMTDAKSHAAESFRTLRTNLLFSGAVTSLRHMIVTSAGPSEGKSSTAANLAVAFAQQGKRVLLIDCDLRRPRLHKIFRTPQIPGLTSSLVSGASHVDTISSTGIENLSVMTAGPIPPNPVELLGSDRMGALISRLSERFDILVFDTPPVLVASDAAILSRHVDGTLFVVRAGKTQAAAIRDALARLGQVGTRILGVTVNDPSGDMAKFASYYGYYYRDYYGADTVAT